MKVLVYLISFIGLTGHLVSTFNLGQGLGKVVTKLDDVDPATLDINSYYLAMVCNGSRNSPDYKEFKFCMDIILKHEGAIEEIVKWYNPPGVDQSSISFEEMEDIYCRADDTTKGKMNDHLGISYFDFMAGGCFLRHGGKFCADAALVQECLVKAILKWKVKDTFA